MIPFATPQTGEVLNLSQVVRLRVVRTDNDPQGGEVELSMSDGTKRIYSGEAARFVNIEMHFLLNAWRQFQIASSSPLVGPDGNSPARIM